jgi:hypothetical protein
MQQTAAVLDSTGGAAKVTAKHVDELANSLSRKAGVDDEAIQAGLNMLLTFKNIRNEAGKGNAIFDRTATSMVDVAAGMAAASEGAISFKSASIQIGKALNDPIAGMSALTRVGIQFTEQQTKQIEKLVANNDLMGAQKIILGELSSQFAGSAEAQATASGKVSVAFENLAETIGGLLAPAITVLAEGLQVVIAFLQDEAPAAWKAFVQAIQPVIDVIGSTLIPLFNTAWNAIKNQLLPALKDLLPIFKLIGGAVLVMAGIMLAQVALVVTAISFVIDIIGEIVKAFMKVVDWVKGNLAEPIVGALQKVGDFIVKVAEFVKDKFLGAWNAIKAPVLAGIASIAAAVQTLVGWIQSAVEWLGRLTGGLGDNLAREAIDAGLGDVIRVPGAATGGFVARSGLAMIHQGEHIIPAGGGMGGDIVLQIDGQTFARITRDQLLKHGKRNAGTGL